MNFPVSSEHSCTEVCARTTVRKAQGASNLPGEDKGFTTAFHKRPNNKLLLEIQNEQESEHWLHFSSCWNIPHSCKWLSDLWDTDQNRKLNPRSRSEQHLTFHQLPAALYLCSRTEQWNEQPSNIVGPWADLSLFSYVLTPKSKK